MIMFKYLGLEARAWYFKSTLSALQLAWTQLVSEVLCIWSGSKAFGWFRHSSCSFGRWFRVPLEVVEVG